MAEEESPYYGDIALGASSVDLGPVAGEPASPQSRGRCACACVCMCVCVYSLALVHHHPNTRQEEIDKERHPGGRRET